MKVTKNQLRSIIREAVRRKLDLGPLDEMPVSEPLKIDGPIITMESLQQLVDEEYALAVMLREDAPDLIPGTPIGRKKAPASPPPLPQKKPAEKGLPPGEQLRRFKTNVNMAADALGRCKEMGVKEALPWLDKAEQFITSAKAAVKR